MFSSAGRLTIWWSDWLRQIKPYARRQASGAEPAHTPFEAVEVEGSHLAAVGNAQAEHGCLCGWDAAGVLIDQELVAGALPGCLAW